MKDKIPPFPFPEIKCYGGLAGEITSSHESVMLYNMNLDEMKKLKIYFQTLWNIV